MTCLPSRPISGPSPRVREHFDRAASVCYHGRSIPACAGNMPMRLMNASSLPVHPRVCGEHPWRAPELQTPRRSIPACAGNMTDSVCEGGIHSGPSPRVRGTCHLVHREALIQRSIPACAGNMITHRCTGAGPVGPSPRVRGTWSIKGAVTNMHPGPSPRVRGTCTGWCGDVGRRRSIPACAGNISSPRCPLNLAVGPSPRVRGT